MKNNLDLLIEVLSIPSFSREETLMIAYLEDFFEKKEYTFFKDSVGNLYVTKGESDEYPCVCAHTDTVHPVIGNLEINEESGWLYAVDSTTKKPTGIGGDDKCGVYLCLQMLERLDVVKAAFFVGEEIGCYGSRQLDRQWFKNVAYVIEYDAPGNDIVTVSCSGISLYSPAFLDCIRDILDDNGYDNYYHAPFTDVKEIRRIVGIDCFDISCGYYHHHTNKELVKIEDVFKAEETGIKLIHRLKEKNYPRSVDKNIFNELKFFSKML